jgi:hypothetical protein
MNKLQQIISQILEDMNISGDVLGTLPSQPSTPIYNPPSDIASGDKYAKGVNYIPKALGVQKRKFPETIITNSRNKRKYKLKKSKKKK